MIANELRRLAVGTAFRSRSFPEKLVDGVVLDLMREDADLGQHLAAERLVPAEVALDVDPLRALLFGFPNRFTYFNAITLHRVIAGDDAGTLIAEHANRKPLEPRSTHDLGGSVETVGIAKADE